MINNKKIIRKIFPDIDCYNHKVFKKSNLFRLYYKDKLSNSEKGMVKEAKDFIQARKKRKGGWS